MREWAPRIGAATKARTVAWAGMAHRVEQKVDRLQVHFVGHARGGIALELVLAVRVVPSALCGLAELHRALIHSSAAASERME